MKHPLTEKLSIASVICFFIISTMLAAGCSGAKVKAKYEPESGSGYSKAEHKHKKNGPPPHAPAHGYRAKHKYRYYPDSSVYHDTERGLYFYIKAGNWEVGASLPYELQMGLGEYVSLELDTDRPYTYHADHEKQYPPGKTKKNKKNKNKKNKWG